MDADNSSYKQFHETYMSNHTGSTVWEILSLITPCPILIYFVSYLLDSFPLTRFSTYSFIIEFIILVLPTIFVYTILNLYNHIFLIFIVLFYLISVWSVLRQTNKRFMNILFSLVLLSNRRAYITYFRSISNILTVFCILAVDFTIFPRRFAKTESYGFSLMDTGVGFFIVSNGLVTKPDINENLIKSLKSCIPIIILGAIRCVSVNVLDYQQHVSEYGMYWNFFFTLAVVKLMCPLLLSTWPNCSFLISITLAFMHQSALSSGIEDWIINDNSREDILSANKEGFLSLPGYLSLYMAAVYIGKFLSSENIDLRVDLSKAVKLFSLSAMFFTLLFTLLSKINVSRRLMNITYIIWLLSLTFFLLGLCILIEISVRLFHFVKGKSKQENVIPIIIDAVNYNGLFFFLIANLLTGLINLSMNTLYKSNLSSITILVTYMIFICYVAYFMYKHKLKLSL